MRTPIQSKIDEIRNEQGYALAGLMTPAEIADWAVRRLEWALEELQRRENALAGNRRAA